MISPSCAASTARSRSRCGRVWWPRSASTAQPPPTHARSPRALKAASKSAAASASTTSTLEQWAARLAADHQIRRSGQLGQGRPSPVVGWADIPGLSSCVGRRPATWLQSWLQSGRNDDAPRPSAFQAWHVPSWLRSRGCCVPSLIAPARRWLLSLLSAASEKRFVSGP